LSGPVIEPDPPSRDPGQAGPAQSNAHEGQSNGGGGRVGRRTLLGVALVAGAGGAGFSLWRAKRQAEEDRGADGAVQLFFQQTLPDSNGAVFAFEQLRGKPVVINFWATWCAPCVEEMPQLSSLAQETRDTGVRFVGLGVDNQDAIARFSARLPVSYPLVVANATGAFLAGRFGNAAGGLPFTVVLSAAGKVKQQILGRVNIDSLREVLKSQDLR
jgi:thiol-disulfide isomerase/thioredoxin